MGEFRYSYMDFEHNSLGVKLQRGISMNLSVLGSRACVCIHIGSMPILYYMLDIFPYYVIYIHICTGMYVYVVYYERTCMQYCSTYPFIESMC